MTSGSRMLAPALRSYSGAITRPGRWTTWIPRVGDILVCTPPKCGTTWTQTMLAMLVHGGPDLPEKIPVLSPWIDADLGVPADAVAAALAAQPGRRVVKTHTPADGFPIWEGVTVVAVYRDPLDVFFSLRRHVANRARPEPGSPMLLPLAQSLQAFIDDPLNLQDFDRDALSTLVHHFRETACTGRLPDLRLFHYGDMLRDHRGAVAALAQAAGIAASDAVIDRVTAATAFETMKANAANYTPVAGTGFWKSDEGFFHSGSSRKWENELTAGDVAHFRSRLAELLPDETARRWLEQGRPAH